MQKNQSLANDRAVSTSPRLMRREQIGQMSGDDTPPDEFQYERYAAWSATSFSGFVPFSSPPER